MSGYCRHCGHDDHFETECSPADEQIETIDFEERAFNAVKAGTFILDFINEFEHSGDRERARYEFKRAQSILKETLPTLKQS